MDPKTMVTMISNNPNTTTPSRGGRGGLRTRDKLDENSNTREMNNRNIPRDDGPVLGGGKENAPTPGRTTRFHHQNNKGSNGNIITIKPASLQKKKLFQSWKKNENDEPSSSSSTIQNTTPVIIASNENENTKSRESKNRQITNKKGPTESTVKVDNSGNGQHHVDSGRGLLSEFHARTKEELQLTKQHYEKEVFVVEDVLSDADDDEDTAIEQQKHTKEILVVKDGGLYADHDDDDDSDEDSIDDDHYILKRTNSFDEFASYWEEGGLRLMQSKTFDEDEDADDESGDAVKDEKDALCDLVQDVVQLSVVDSALLVNKGEITDIAQELAVRIQVISKELNMTEDESSSYVLVDQSKEGINKGDDPSESNMASLIFDDSSSDSQDLEILALCRPTLTGAAAKNNKGYEFLQKGNYKKAMQLFNKAREDLLEVGCTGALHPRLPLLNDHLDDEALEVACSMEMANVVANMAEYHLRMKDHAMAVSTAKNALECDHNNDQAWFCMARGEFHMKHYYQAALASEKVKDTSASAGEARSLYELIKQELQPVIDEHETSFRRIIDSYRLRVADENEIGIVGRNSIYDIQKRSSQQEDGEKEEIEYSDDEEGSFVGVGTLIRGGPTVGLLLTGDYFKSVPLTHFRGYLRSLLLRDEVLPEELQTRLASPSGDLLQALCFMAISDATSNIRFPATEALIEAHSHEHGGHGGSVESLREYAERVLGPVDSLLSIGKVNVIECCMSDTEEMFNEETLSEFECN